MIPTSTPGSIHNRNPARQFPHAMLGPSDLWYKDAVIYALNVETFQDSDGDGVGDFAGLTSRVDYLHALGVTCVWLLPFYPSPNRDNRYDVADYYGVDPRLGTLGDFVDFLRSARERGIRVLIDLVVNHTSDQHPWFLEARRDPTSRYRDYYVWAPTPPANHADGMMFPGVEESTWTHDETAGAYYFHRFYGHQPDLNLGNPAVREEIRKIIGFWLELGVSGFRLDAAPFLIERKGIQPDRVEARRPHTFFRYMRSFLSWRRGDAVLLAEANVPMDDVEEFVGAGDKLQMLLNFHANQYLFLSLATRRAQPLADALRRLAPLPPTAQWANFIRSHDELDIGALTDEEREIVYGEFAPEPRMRLYDRGIRRRIAPMLGNDRRRLELTHSLLLAIPGTPVIRYGDEIGMGEDLSLPERMTVRTPMQWSAKENGGFSTAPSARLPRPVVDEEPYAPAQVNVADQQRDPASFLNWLQRAIGIRKAVPELARGEWEVFETGHPAVVGITATLGRERIVTLHNLDENPCVARAKQSIRKRAVTELLSDQLYAAVDDGSDEVPLGPFGYRWFRLSTAPDDE